MESLLQQLQHNKIVKTGDFVLKSGKRSPVYADFRELFSKPLLFKQLVEACAKKLCKDDFEHVCGIPYAGIPYATYLSLYMNKSLLMCRKELKQHGAKKKVEGCFQAGQSCLVVEDVITTGNSLVEFVDLLRGEGLVVEHALVFLCREDSAKKHLEQHGLRVDSIFNLQELVKHELV